MKSAGVFNTPTLAMRARANVAAHLWAAEMREAIIRQAEAYLRFSDDELWELMFGCTISRSWMVWSNGYCPACKGDVPMYDWQIEALKYPWKVRCPHCQEFFPKNDFLRFYRSGLDGHGVFDPARADRALLYNLEHPSPDDPLHRFGVDDGEGYVEGDKRWRFIGAYLIYGQWKQAVLGGIKSLAAPTWSRASEITPIGPACSSTAWPTFTPPSISAPKAWSTRGEGVPAMSPPGTTPARIRASWSWLTTRFLRR